MALPIVAIVGRPNVGKSTLVNRISQKKDAIVHEMRGVTRDRSYHQADWNGREFTLIDTGGIEMGNDDRFQQSIREQAFAATNEADVILFLVDGQTGINSDDEEVARILRKATKPVLLLVNKIDTPGREDQLWEFYKLGLGDPWAVSATHGTGTGDVLDEVVSLLPENYDEPEPEDDVINVAIIGRPNAGKSTLTNLLTKKDRSIVSDVAGTTRDAIDTLVEHEGKRYRIIYTAGLRAKSKIDEDVEYCRVCPRAWLRHGHLAQQMGPGRRPRQESGDSRTHRRSHDVCELCARHCDHCDNGQEHAPNLDGRGRGLRELLPNDPDEQAEYLAHRDQGFRFCPEQGQEGSEAQIRHADRHMSSGLHVLRESSRPHRR